MLLQSFADADSYVDLVDGVEVCGCLVLGGHQPLLCMGRGKER